jgi:RNA polymerase sigma factor (sigma-70 family)
MTGPRPDMSRGASLYPRRRRKADRVQPEGRLTLSDQSAESARRDHFEKLFAENYHRILGYALRRTSRDDAADIVAETFLVAWRRVDEVPDRGTALLWLYGTARRVLANQERAARRRERLAERARADASRKVEPGLLEGAENLAALAFARLPAAERELLALVAWEGLDAGEIAQIYACSRNAARIRLHRARRRFARELARVSGSMIRTPKVDADLTHAGP